MKSICAIGTIALVCSNVLPADEVQANDHITSEILSLPELLSYLEDTVSQLIDADEETCQIAQHELQESLRIIYTLSCLHPKEAANILQTLDECYANLTDAIDRNTDKRRVLEQSLSMFIFGRNYDNEALTAQPLQEWTNTAPSNKLKSAIETTEADLVYIQNNVSLDTQEHTRVITIHNPSRLLYSMSPAQNSTPKILIIKSDDSTEYKVEGGYKWKLGGKDHGKSSAYFEGEVKDKNGNYAKGKVSKENGDDGYDCEVKAGKEKKKK